MKYTDIPQYTRSGYYIINNPISHMLSNKKNEGWLNRYVKMGLQLNPEFQRGNVWTEEQQIKYIEYRLRAVISLVGLFILTNLIGCLEKHILLMYIMILFALTGYKE
jgi:uncharacterized membrane protein YkgB